MQTILALALTLAAAGYCLLRASRLWRGRASGCGKCAACPQSGAKPLVQLGAGSGLTPVRNQAGSRG